MNNFFNSLAENPEHYAVQPVAIVVTGVPGSGKTTMLKQMFGEELYNRHVVSSDFFVEQEAAKIGKTYTEGFSEVIGKAQELMTTKMVELRKKGQMILWDQTNISHKKRRQIHSRLENTHHLYLMVFDVPEDIVEQRVEERASRTGKIIPPHIRKSMAENFDPSADPSHPFVDTWYWSQQEETGFKPKYAGQYLT